MGLKNRLKVEVRSGISRAGEVRNELKLGKECVVRSGEGGDWTRDSPRGQVGLPHESQSASLVNMDEEYN